MIIEIILFVLSVLMIINFMIPKKEGMTGPSAKFFKEKYKSLKNNDIYDSFYVSIYDKLFMDPSRFKFEIQETIENTKIDENSRILDIGSSTGHHVRAFQQYTKHVEGLDTSNEMIKYAKNKYPLIPFTKANAMDGMIYDPNSFTHITAYYFTIYQFNDLYGFLSNVYKWLEPNGYFIVHMVNRKMFDPILSPANPIIMVSPQKYAKERITTSEIKFNDFKYKGQFSLDEEKDKAIFEETFVYDDNNHTRKHVHEYNAPKLTSILKLAQDIGFNVIKRIDMVTCEYEYQYIYIMQK